MYVIDTDSLLTIAQIVPEENINFLLEDLVPLVERGDICFPDLVIAEVRQLAHGESVALWVRSVAGSRTCKSVAYQFTIQVLATASELLDDTGEEESSQVAVAAMALHFRAGGGVRVVTEDRRPLPTRSNLVQACQSLGIEAVSALAFIKSIGLDCHLSVASDP
ncbi:hypothetical protein AB0N56_26155 [Streptomyces microflavus]|uniref:hypothetical protein n=1 Tax=Streptomyces griseus group TaxID=629295 RepID=UPI001D18D779|nr:MULTISPECIES: hypothetical protein [Streptomyces griseus group]